MIEISKRSSNYEGNKKFLRELKALEGPFQKFSTKNLPDNPTDLFMEWLNIAIEKGVSEPPKMVVSTTDITCAPDARVLILKNITKNKWYFSTSDISKKGEQLQSNNKVALTFYWSELGKQVRIRGVSKKMLEDVNSVDFLERPNSARAIGLIGNQSKILLEQKDLEEELLKMEKLIKKAPKTVNTNWSQYEVEAYEVEFWQADSKRKHIRVQYKRDTKDWMYHL